MIYSIIKTIVRPNPNWVTGSKLPTHIGYSQGKKKDGTEFEIKVSAFWKNQDGSLTQIMQDNQVNSKTGVKYSGYCIVKRSDVDEANGVVPETTPEELNATIKTIQ